MGRKGRRGSEEMKQRRRSEGEYEKERK